MLASPVCYSLALTLHFAFWWFPVCVPRLKDAKVVEMGGRSWHGIEFTYHIPRQNRVYRNSEFHFPLCSSLHSLFETKWDYCCSKPQRPDLLKSWTWGQCPLFNLLLLLVWKSPWVWIIYSFWSQNCLPSLVNASRHTQGFSDVLKPCSWLLEYQGLRQHATSHTLFRLKHSVLPQRCNELLILG